MSNQFQRTKTVGISIVAVLIVVGWAYVAVQIDARLAPLIWGAPFAAALIGLPLYFDLRDWLAQREKPHD